MAFIKNGDDEKIIKVIQADDLDASDPESWKESEQKLEKDGNKIPSSVESKNLN